MNPSSFKQNLLTYIADNFDIDIEDIDDNTPLFSSSILDSFSMVDLVTFVEQEINTKIEALDLHLDNLDSVEKITAFVQRKIV
ncbi:acyl carrier protein [Sedimenticola selenatireducens]|uniref:acyl carrier protein n=1 Tax=Sedimenticola selenatireducens TaxID=191960 RepID=UPI0004B243CD|nr:acyl carrier protein [Sedimenticola selenatireducens]